MSSLDDRSFVSFSDHVNESIRRIDTKMASIQGDYQDLDARQASSKWSLFKKSRARRMDIMEEELRVLGKLRDAYQDALDTGSKFVQLKLTFNALTDEPECVAQNYSRLLGRVSNRLETRGDSYRAVLGYSMYLGR